MVGFEYDTLPNPNHFSFPSDHFNRPFMSSFSKKRQYHSNKWSPSQFWNWLYHSVV